MNVLGGVLTDAVLHVLDPRMMHSDYGRLSIHLVAGSEQTTTSGAAHPDLTKRCFPLALELSAVLQASYSQVARLWSEQGTL